MSTAILSRATLSTVTMIGSPLMTAAIPRLRITKRGRRVLVFLVAVPLVIAAAGFALNGGMAAATSVASTASLEYVTVGAGQSLWQLAVEIAPAADPRDVISDIVHLNQLTGTEIQAGQRLALPAKYAH
ncbi:MAG: LysM peptidoglycan-binding domain-containing protein [Lacisediminihabitans sp.]